MQQPIFGTESSQTFSDGNTSPIIINYNNYLNVLQFNLKENPFYKNNNSNKFTKIPTELKRNHSSNCKFTNESNYAKSIISEETCCGLTTSETNTILPQPTSNQQIGNSKHKSFQIVLPQSKYISKFYSLLLLITIMSFFLLISAFPLSLLLPKNTKNVLITFLQEDDYYCYFVPLIIPLTVIIIYINWVCMKFFRHS